MRGRRPLFVASLLLLLSLLSLGCASARSDALSIVSDPAAEYAADQLVTAFAAAHPEVAIRRTADRGAADLEIALTGREIMERETLILEDPLVLWGIRNRQLRLRKDGVTALRSDRVKRVVVLEAHRALALSALEALEAGDDVLRKVAAVSSAGEAIAQVSRSAAEFAILPESVTHELGGPEGRFWTFPPDAAPPLRVVIRDFASNGRTQSFIEVANRTARRSSED